MEEEKCTRCGEAIDGNGAILCGKKVYAHLCDKCWAKVKKALAILEEPAQELEAGK